MNIYQRIVLVLGAIALVMAIWTAPRVIYVKDSYLEYDAQNHSGLAPVTDPRTVLTRSVGVIGVTVLVFFAMKDIREKRQVKRRKTSKQN